jgi:hypothetical protein
MAKKKELTAEAAWAELFERLRADMPAITKVAAQDTGISVERLERAFDDVLDLVAEPVPTPEQIKRWRKQGMELARQGAPAERVLDGYLSLIWAIWEGAMRQEHIAREVILQFADRLLRGIDDAMAAISEGYVRVEVELAAAHSDQRRAVLEELLAAPRTTPEDRARIRLRGERHGLATGGTYRLILVHAGEIDEHHIEAVADDIEKRIRAPQPHHRVRPGIRLPAVLDWRGRVLIFSSGAWTGEKRLRDALPKVLGDEIVVVDSGLLDGFEALPEALTQAGYSATVAASLGRYGWLDSPGQVALETTFLLDDQLVRLAVEQELGPLLADQRMGEELLETLEVYLGSRQNIRESARRMHLAPRTVAYRLERIETLLGTDLDGGTAVRLSAALLALRVSRRAGRFEAAETEK